MWDMKIPELSEGAKVALRTEFENVLEAAVECGVPFDGPAINGPPQSGGCKSAGTKDKSLSVL